MVEIAKQAEVIFHITALKKYKVITILLTFILEMSLLKPEFAVWGMKHNRGRNKVNWMLWTWDSWGECLVNPRIIV